MIDRNKYIDTAVKKFKKVFIGEGDILSLYIYGSTLSDQFDPHRSDVDLLAICKDSGNPIGTINKIKGKLHVFSGMRLDMNIVFLSEFKRRWHIYRPPSYYLGIKYQHRLVFGKDLLVACKDSEVGPEQIYKRIVDLAQGSRGVYVNGKDPEFWAKKYVGWLKVAILEILFLTGEFDLSFLSGIKKLLTKFPRLKPVAHIITKKNLSIGEVNKIAEKLRVFVEEEFDLN